MYLSSPLPEKVTLAAKSWEYFSRFLGRYQWANDDPSHSPRGSEIGHAILNRGKPGACSFFRPEGYKYILPVLHPRHFKDAIANRRKIYYVSFGSQALLYFDIDLHYAWQTLAHGQDAKARLDAMLRGFFGDSVLFWSPSSRGFNGYLKVDLKRMSYALANELFDRLEAALQLFLASCENLADFEIKGKIGFMQDDGQYHWAHYGKLPIHLPEWSFAKLEEFKATPTVSIHRLGVLCGHIEAQVPQDVLTSHKESKKGRGDEPFKNGYRFLVTPAIETLLLEKHGECWRCRFSLQWGSGDDTWLHERYYRPGVGIRTDAELREEKEKQDERLRICTLPGGDASRGEEGTPSALEGVDFRCPQEHKRNNGQVDAAECRNVTSDVQARTRHGNINLGTTDDGIAARLLPTAGRHTRQSVHGRDVVGRRSINLDFSDLMGEPDSLKRQTKALLRYARYLKRVPTHEEGMQIIHDHHLYTGSWEDNLARRRIRIRDILNFIARTFDASKCANGSVNVGKYDEWAKNKFPNGLSGGHRRYMDEDGNVIEVPQNIRVSTRFIAVFMAVTEFALLIDKNKDNSFPHDRADDLWDALYAKGLISVRFNARKWAVCRDEIEKHEIIAILDRNYGPGKAMKWEASRFFPGLGLWKTKREPSPMGPVDLASFLEGKREKRKEEHNTFLQSQAVEDDVLSSLSRSRPPP